MHLNTGGQLLSEVSHDPNKGDSAQQKDVTVGCPKDKAGILHPVCDDDSQA